MNILVLNSGSSTVKFQIIATDMERIRGDADERLLRGEVEKIGGEAIVTVQKSDGLKQNVTASVRDVPAALDFVIRWVSSKNSGITQISSVADIHAVGHRVVHGGEGLTESGVITDDVLKEIESCIDLAPLHNPNSIKGILAGREIFGHKIPQVAVFDTAFHQALPEHSYLYAIPYDLYLRHRIRRYGFHGTSYRYVTNRYL